MITQWYNPDWNMEYRISITADRAWANLDEIFEWAKANSQGSITRGDMEWIYHVGTFTVGISTHELALEFVLRFG